MIVVQELTSLIEEFKTLMHDVELGEKINTSSYKALIQNTIGVLSSIRVMAVTMETLKDDVSLLKKYAAVAPENKIEFTPFVKTVLNKIDILKNIIRQKDKIEDDAFLVPQLLAVETIESEIKQQNSVTKHQMESLNSIYSKYTTV